MDIKTQKVSGDIFRKYFQLIIWKQKKLVGEEKKYRAKEKTLRYKNVHDQIITVIKFALSSSVYIITNNLMLDIHIYIKNFRVEIDTTVCLVYFIDDIFYP